MNNEIILTAKMIKSIRKYVWKRLDNQCWPWIGYQNEDGYGRFHINDKGLYYAHRVVYVEEFGSFDWDLLVCHTCDNPPCCNPKHLFLGTDLDNTRDRETKGRRDVKGVDHGCAKINEDDVRKIRFKCALGISQEDVGKEFGLDQTTISLIIRYKRWKHVK